MATDVSSLVSCVEQEETTRPKNDRTCVGFVRVFSDPSGSDDDWMKSTTLVGCVLIFQENASQPIRWKLVGGKNKPLDKDPNETMLRELNEEIDICPDDVINCEHITDELCTANDGHSYTKHLFTIDIFESTARRIAGFRGNDSERNRFFPTAEFLPLTRQILVDGKSIMPYHLSMIKTNCLLVPFKQH